MKTRVTQITVLPDDAPIFDEMAMHVSISDEAGGEYVTIQQPDINLASGEIKIDPEEWPQLRQAINRMIKQCRKNSPDKAENN